MESSLDIHVQQNGGKSLSQEGTHLICSDNSYSNIGINSKPYNTLSPASNLSESVDSMTFSVKNDIVSCHANRNSKLTWALYPKRYCQALDVC